MKPYTKTDVQNIYKYLMDSAHKNYERHQVKAALKDIESAAMWAYSFNFIYRDDNSENLLIKIAESELDNIHLENPFPDRYVLIDSFCLDNRGLTQQYMRAIMQTKKEILYICTSNTVKGGKDILRELEEYAKTNLLLFTNSKLTYLEKAEKIVDIIKQFSPSCIFLHLTPWDTIALMACHVINGACIYNINLTDHAYWMGASVIDYNFEFRPYGMTVSLEKRGLQKKQLLPLPYYPITPIQKEFKGLANLPDSAIKVFTGGSLYKVLGKNDIFFKIMESILEIHPNVYILVAGFEHSKIFDEKCSRIQNSERVIQIGIRDDVDAVFENVDIYLGTYPMTGGLMAQYAAKHGKPIIAYHDEGDVMNAVEEIVNHYQNGFRTYTNIADMIAYASKLINDVEFRKDEGNVLLQGLMSSDRFTEAFANIMENSNGSWEWNKDQIDYESFFNRYLDLENNNGFMTTATLIRQQKILLLKKVKEYKWRMLGKLMVEMSRLIQRRLLFV